MAQEELEQLSLYPESGTANAVPSSKASSAHQGKNKKQFRQKKADKVSAARKRPQLTTRHVTIEPGRVHLMRRPEVERVTGLSRSALYRLLKCGDFPKQVSLSSMAVAWLASEVEAWISARVAASRLPES